MTEALSAHEIGELLRELAPQVLGAMVRRYGQFGACEDAVLEAMSSWPARGVPDSPKGWMLTVASRRLIDEVRSEHARRRREQDHAAATAPLQPPGQPQAPALDHDDSLALLFLCCHPALSGPSQIALTLRAVGGLSTAQIAAAFLVPEATMAQRISRAKEAIRASGARFGPGAPTDERPERLGIVLHVLYLIFNEGYTATAGTGLTAPELTGEAIRLTRWLHRLLPEDAEVTGLLALMLLTDARRPARTSQDGSLIPLDEQDRSRWDSGRVAEGVTLISAVL